MNSKIYRGDLGVCCRWERRKEENCITNEEKVFNNYFFGYKLQLGGMEKGGKLHIKLGKAQPWRQGRIYNSLGRHPSAAHMV